MFLFSDLLSCSQIMRHQFSDAPTQPHQDIVKYPCIEKEPGFLGLVNSKSLKNFLDCPDDAHLPVAPAVAKPQVVAINTPGHAAYILEHAKYNAYRLFLNYKKYGTPASRAAFYPMAACDDAWFDPFATNTAGKRCFSAALQNPSYGTGCEPGNVARYCARGFARPSHCWVALLCKRNRYLGWCGD